MRKDIIKKSTLTDIVHDKKLRLTEAGYRELITLVNKTLFLSIETAHKRKCTTLQPDHIRRALLEVIRKDDRIFKSAVDLD